MHVTMGGKGGERNGSFAKNAFDTKFRKERQVWLGQGEGQRNNPWNGGKKEKALVEKPRFKEASYKYSNRVSGEKFTELWKSGLRVGEKKTQNLAKKANQGEGRHIKATNNARA